MENMQNNAIPFNYGAGDTKGDANLLRVDLRRVGEITDGEPSVFGAAVIKSDRKARIASRWNKLRFWLPSLVSAVGGTLALSNPDFMNGYKGTSTPENYIKKMYANPKWIPICGDGSGNHIGIDLDPDVNGKSGQIITFGTDESNKIVIAEDLNSFFERLTRIVNSNHFSIDEFDDENVISLNIDEDYGIFLTDYFKMNTAVK